MSRIIQNGGLNTGRKVMKMRNKLNIVLLVFIITAISLGCIGYQKSPIPNETKISTPSVTEQKLPVPNTTEPIRVNGTFVTWSRGYYSNLSNPQTYWVITNYSEWNDFLYKQDPYLEGQIFPGSGVKPRTIVPDDFNNSFIIVATMSLIGQAEGDGVEIKNISRINNVVNVTVHMSHFTYGDVVIGPYHIVLVNRSILPIGNSTFVFIDTDGRELGKVEVSE